MSNTCSFQQGEPCKNEITLNHLNPPSSTRNGCPVDHDGLVDETLVELEANYWSYGSPAITHKRAKHSAFKLIVRATALNLCVVKSTPGKSPVAGTRLPNTKTGDGMQELGEGDLHLRECPQRSCLLCFCAEGGQGGMRYIGS